MNSFSKILFAWIVVLVFSVSGLLASPADKIVSGQIFTLPGQSLLNLKDVGAKPLVDISSDVDDNRLLGTWQIRYTLDNYCEAALNFTFDEDGNYSSETACEDGSLPFRANGSWSSVRDGVVQVEFSDWEPKYGAMGKPIEFPRIQKMSYRFINENRMIFTGRTANRIE